MCTLKIMTGKLRFSVFHPPLTLKKVQNKMGAFHKKRFFNHNPCKTVKCIHAKASIT